MKLDKELLHLSMVMTGLLLLCVPILIFVCMNWKPIVTLLGIIVGVIALLGIMFGIISGIIYGLLKLLNKQEDLFPEKLKKEFSQAKIQLNENTEEVDDRQTANREIIKILSDIIETSPQLRFHQILMNSGLEEVGVDKFYEESTTTLEGLK